ncbi:hypothetical protein [Thiolinea disciformis]|uniref:hypothetical protein n=1 Tax=Thiolinea disciformis TaxID=125614 RepID=UPI0003600E86|nr:hypothetical protein [Thiolinea disciformis]
MEIKLPSIAQQQAFILQKANEEAIQQIQATVTAPLKSGVKITDTSHLLREQEGWQAPSADVVRLYFDNFKQQFPAYDSDQKMAYLLGIKSDRRVREWRSGEYKVPYGIWRRFLIMTGRAPQEIVPVLGVFKDE